MNMNPESIERESAESVIEKYGPKTAYFDRSLSMDCMEDMLRNRMHFGFAETMVILAALVKAGAKFKGGVPEIDN